MYTFGQRRDVYLAGLNELAEPRMLRLNHHVAVEIIDQMLWHLRPEPDVGRMDGVFHMPHDVQAGSPVGIDAAELAVHDHNRHVSESIRHPDDRLLDDLKLERLYGGATIKRHIVGSSICRYNDTVEVILQRPVGSSTVEGNASLVEAPCHELAQPVHIDAAFLDANHNLYHVRIEEFPHIRAAEMQPVLGAEGHEPDAGGLAAFLGYGVDLAATVYDGLAVLGTEGLESGLAFGNCFRRTWVVEALVQAKLIGSGCTTQQFPAALIQVNLVAGAGEVDGSGGAEQSGADNSDPHVTTSTAACRTGGSPGWRSP